MIRIISIMRVFDTIRIIYIIRIIIIIVIIWMICTMNIIIFSAWVGFLNGISRKCRRSYERCSFSRDTLSWEIHPWKSDCHARSTRIRHSRTGIETHNTHMSNSAEIRRSRDFSSVGCQIGMSTSLSGGIGTNHSTSQPNNNWISRSRSVFKFCNAACDCGVQLL